MADHITTYGGTHFNPVDPDPDRIFVTDIAHALSLICRGNGHVRTFFSVGQHCIWCAGEAQARGYSPRVVLACLLHDASEAYMSDVPRPFKKFLDQYLSLEEKLLTVIYTKYLGSDLTQEEKRLVKAIDDAVLYYDLKELLSECTDSEEPSLSVPPCYDPVPFETVEKTYLEWFESCRAALETGGKDA